MKTQSEKDFAEKEKEINIDVKDIKVWSDK